MIRAVLFDYDTLFSANGQQYPGADSFIHACASRFPLLLMTILSRAEAANSLRNNDLAHLFLDILTSAEVEHGKPAPDLLFATLGRIGFLLRDRNPVEPRECLVVERSAEGIEAARRAGMRSLAISIHISSGELAAANFVRDSFEAIDLDDILRGCAG